MDFTKTKEMEREELNFYMQKSPSAEISQLCSEIGAKTTVRLIQKPTPQTLLVPVKDPINGGTFLAGEVLVTSAIVQVDGNNGWAMVMDDNPEMATNLAILDGAFAAGIDVDEIIRLAGQGRKLFNAEKEKENEQVAGTRVAFDLL
jgi:alpha-D-ribose 1-methylphosphonate 5-triphosphate synthase subunit PhnG